MTKTAAWAPARLGTVLALSITLSAGAIAPAHAQSATGHHSSVQARTVEQPNLFQRLVRFFFPTAVEEKPVIATTVVMRPFTYEQLDPKDIEAAIHRSSQLTGVPQSYLYKTAWKESSFNPNAEAKTSSASGLYQMVDGTWLELMKRYGAKYGLAEEAERIIRTGDGDLWVAGAAERRRIMDLRFDARISALLAAELAAENQRILEDGLGRDVGDTDLYIAHFIGPANAVKLIGNAERSPGRTAANLFPTAARANKPIFYTPGGRARSCAEVVRRLRLA